MKAILSIITVAALAFSLPANAATTDPEVVLYRAAGVADNGPGGNTATLFSCTPFSGVSENIRVVLRAQNGTLLNNAVTTVPHLTTQIFSTVSGSAVFTVIIIGNTAIAGGTVAIAATSTSVTCTAMLMQATSTAPVGIPLHLTRFSPLAGTDE